MIVRLERPGDYRAVERLTFAAFETFTFPDGSKPPQVNEHYLAHIMRDVPAFVPELDFVGEQDGEIVANIMYTQSKIVRPSGEELATLTFGPVSIAPERHNQGFGTKIIRHSLDCTRRLGYGAVIILGHPTYYPRFAFKPASEYKLTLPDGSILDAFMALELRGGYLCADGGKWYEDKVFAIDPTAFEKWNKEFHAIDDYIAAQAEAIQPLLQSVLKTLRRVLPAAMEKISWQMPTFWQGRNLIHFAAQKNHLGIYPGAEAMKHFAPLLAEYKTSKGAVRFAYKTCGGEQLALIAKIAAWCAEHNAK
ncbi:MAG: DUF1801 domain-containing protein [Clostridiales bacterium]|jgi:predicted N-acetyltransferase YhbS/uncharacterized protein YdhG (YjbR/CyaY superfamily)|nr:DUF1801 domain-containing protein [Clostridiales bacterium]